VRPHPPSRASGVRRLLDLGVDRSPQLDVGRFVRYAPLQNAVRFAMEPDGVRNLDKVQALAEGALRVLRGEETAHEFVAVAEAVAN